MSITTTTPWRYVNHYQIFDWVWQEYQVLEIHKNNDFVIFYSGICYNDVCFIHYKKSFETKFAYKCFAAYKCPLITKCLVSWTLKIAILHILSYAALLHYHVNQNEKCARRLALVESAIEMHITMLWDPHSNIIIIIVPNAVTMYPFFNESRCLSSAFFTAACACGMWRSAIKLNIEENNVRSYHNNNNNNKKPGNRINIQSWGSKLNSRERYANSNARPTRTAIMLDFLLFPLNQWAQHDFNHCDRGAKANGHQRPTCRCTPHGGRRVQKSHILVDQVCSLTFALALPGCVVRVFVCVCVLWMVFDDGVGRTADCRFSHPAQPEQ